MAGLEGYQPVCGSEVVIEGGKGFRFAIAWGEAYAPAFVIRYQDKIEGYLNRCAHQAIELDWSPGEFFDTDSRFLLCATHGALYEPTDGHCVSGRCNGRSLTKLDVREVDGIVYVRSTVPVITEQVA